MRKEVAVDIHQRRSGLMMGNQKILTGLMKGLHLETIHYHQVICNDIASPINNYSADQEILLAVESKVCHIVQPAYLKSFLTFSSDLSLGLLSGFIP
jgi:hypothetical protein